MQIDAIYVMVEGKEEIKERVLFYVGETLTEAIAKEEKENPNWATMTIVLKNGDFEEAPPNMKQAISAIEEELKLQGGDALGIARKDVLRAARRLARAKADLGTD